MRNLERSLNQVREWKEYFLLIDVDTYAGNVERQLVSHAFGVVDEAVRGERPEYDGAFGRDWSPTQEQIENDPELAPITMWKDAVRFQDYDDFTWAQSIEKIQTDEVRWTIVVQIDELSWQEITADDVQFLFGRLNSAANRMGFHILDVRERVTTVTSIDGPLTLPQ